MNRREFLAIGLTAGTVRLGSSTSSITVDFDNTDAVSVPPPKYAIPLLNGVSLDGWVSRNGGPAKWKLGNGYVEVVPGTGDIYTKERFTDFQLHVEFWLPLMAEAQGQARANSGVYLQGLYEIQVLDSYGLVSKKDDCGAIYEIAAPLRNACKKPERWQTYDAAFRAPRFDESGNLKEKGLVTVFQNDILIHHAQEIAGKGTRASMSRDPKIPGPILLQDHGNSVRYRNVWIIPVM
jgi:hypothetical protein